MKAAVFRAFREPLSIEDVEAPIPSASGVVIDVKACGICRSDWHGWMGNDPDITLPHIPGHEIAGVISGKGLEVKNWQIGDRVTLPFVCGCGSCEQCRSDNQQVCDQQFQPGFTAWGGFAENVAIDYADINLVALPDEIDFVTASSLGCRFATSYRAVVDQARVQAGQWLAVFGCGGVGLSAIMIANAVGARVIAIDISDEKLRFAKSIGAEAVINATNDSTVEAILDLTNGGANVTIDALGHPEILINSISSLRKRGKHIQVGIMETGQHRPRVPIEKIIGRELEILGSHGMQAHRYPEMLELIKSGRLTPNRLIGKTVSIEEACRELTELNKFDGTGTVVIDRF